MLRYMSDELRAKIKLSPRRGYEIARAAEVHHTTLSKWLNRIDPIRPDDPRLVRLSKVMGIPLEECLREDQEREGVPA